MDRVDPALPKGSALQEGRRRLRLFLAGFGGAACAAAMVLVLLFYGLPFNPMWWAAMAVVLVAAAVISALFAPLVEWVAKGYLEPDNNNMSR